MISYAVKSSHMETASRLGKRVWNTSLSTNNAFVPYVHLHKRFHTDSMIERKIYEHLMASTPYEVSRGQVVAPELLDPTYVQLIEPDLLVFREGLTPLVAIEIDFPASRGGGSFHTNGWPAWDTYRSDCLKVAGVSVIRLRLGGLEWVPGVENVMCDDDVTQSGLFEIVEIVHAYMGKSLQNRLF